MEDGFKVPDLPINAVKNDKVTDKSGHISGPENQRRVEEAPASAYKIPKWSAAPATDVNYRFEVLKSGQIIDEVKELQLRPYWCFGRLPANDIEMAHPTISRYHAVLQYKPKVEDVAGEDEDDEQEAKQNKQPAGWYIYDLNSTHGTFLNKLRIPPRTYIRMRVGHMLKLGASTRSYILQGPIEDEEPESELSVTELREQREQKAKTLALEQARKALEAEERERQEGVSWGMGDDADEETDLTHNPYASTNNEELFLDDPKRTLRGYFEREGLQLDYKCDEMSAGSFVCRVELPLDDSNGRPIVAEVVHKGRKKDCVMQCALEACRILDRHGVLRQANQEPLKRKQHGRDEESTSSDDDFLDRTGDIARKKERKANTTASVTLTYDDLIRQEEELDIKLQQVVTEINIYQEKQQRLKKIEALQEDASDDLDNFMDTLHEGVSQLDKTEIKKLRLEQQRLIGEHQKVQRLIKIAKPTDLSFVAASSGNATNSHRDALVSKKQLPMIGKRNQFNKFKVVKPVATNTDSKMTNNRAFASDEEEVEEEEHDVATVNATTVVVNTTTSIEPKETEPTQKEPPLKALNSATQQEKLPEATNEEKSKVEYKEVDQVAAMLTDVVADKQTETMSSAAEAEEAASRKRRARTRQRNKHRQDVDVDELEEHEASEKYAKWVPPTNQTGDGITALNEKFGY